MLLLSIQNSAIYNAFVIAFQILEVAPSLHMVELRKSEGDTLEFHKVI